MNDDYMRHDAPQPPTRQHVPGKVLFAFLVGHDRYRCELRDHGPAQGIEAQWFKNEEFSHARTFAPWMGLTLTPREHAVQWAEEERKALKKGDG